MAEIDNTDVNGPVRVSADGMHVEKAELEERVNAERYLKSEAAIKQGYSGLRFIQLNPPGTI